MDEVITQEQKDKYQAAIDSGKGRKEAIAAMNLSDTQKTKIQEIIKLSHQQAEAVLTREQLEKIHQFVRSRLPDPAQ